MPLNVPPTAYGSLADFSGPAIAAAVAAAGAASSLSVGRMPYCFGDVTVVSFDLPADGAKLDAFCRACLCSNDRPDAFIYAKPARTRVSGFVTLDVLHYRSMRLGPCASSNDAPNGKQNELLLRFEVIDNARQQRCVFVPFIWVDNPASAVIGRAVTGYPKLMADFVPKALPRFDAMLGQGVVKMHRAAGDAGPAVSVGWSHPGTQPTLVETDYKDRFVQRRHPRLAPEGAQGAVPDDIVRFHRSSIQALAWSVPETTARQSRIEFDEPLRETLADAIGLKFTDDRCVPLNGKLAQVVSMEWEDDWPS